jgi:predicted DNA-binding transcriptional regulator AlpA
MKMTAENDSLLLSVPQTAKLLNISARTLFELTAPRGPLVPVRLKHRVFFSVRALEAWIASQVGAPAAQPTTNN